MKRVDTYLTAMDSIRDNIDTIVNEKLKRLDIDKLIVYDKKKRMQYIKALCLSVLQTENNIFKQAQREGRKFANGIKTKSD